MAVRKISASVRLEHRLPYNGPGCLGWLLGMEAPEPDDDTLEKGPIAFSIGQSRYLSEAEYTFPEFWEIQASQVKPRVVLDVQEKGRLVKFREDWYWADLDLTREDIAALLEARKVRRDASIQRAKSISSLSKGLDQHRRESIPEDLRLLVWQRDQGTCVKCGSQSELQFDHIIPVALGGATSEQNLQVLCGPCNRTKGASVT